jgi:hypothetical protein
MTNTHSSLTNFIDENKNINQPLVKKIVLLCGEYLSILNNYNISDSKWTLEDHSNPDSTINIITRTINKFKETLETELLSLTEFIRENPLNCISDNEDVDEELDEETDMRLKTFANLLIEQISKVQKQEMIAEGVGIMMKQTVINYEQATQYLIENNYDPVAALLSYMDYKSQPDTQTYFTFQLNQHELINELVKLSPSLIYTENTKTSLSNLTLNKVQSYVCVLVNDVNSMRKIKKYASLSELYNLFVNEELTNINVVSFKINGEHFALLLNANNIVSENDNSSTNNNSIVQKYQLNKPITLTLRNMEFITLDQYYCGPALFINNFFLN